MDLVSQQLHSAAIARGDQHAYTSSRLDLQSVAAYTGNTALREYHCPTSLRGLDFEIGGRMASNWEHVVTAVFDVVDKLEGLPRHCYSPQSQHRNVDMLTTVDQLSITAEHNSPPAASIFPPHNSHRIIKAESNNQVTEDAKQGRHLNPEFVVVYNVYENELIDHLDHFFQPTLPASWFRESPEHHDASCNDKIGCVDEVEIPKLIG
ncbi:hypothetical protein AC579_107 [Pseudocercospora musae]|uniref:Uncharacterized protein n=1 Tax=Pseudocercospora musae TaxID=113226 RepID=A0A139GTD2_9PEZI|nr:hypothetical protein AC579_107 [Pseudocercospora musae]